MKRVFTTLVVLTLVGLLSCGTVWGADVKGNRDLLRSMTPAEMKAARMNTNSTQAVTPAAANKTLATGVYVNANWASETPGNDPDGLGPATAMGTDAFAKIQDAIDAVPPGAVIFVYPGSYNETAANRFLYNATGPYQFGLFFGAAKPGITVQGVDAGGVPVTAAANAVALVTTNATNSFGASGFFVEADNITIAGLKILDNVPGNNKTIEVIGENVTIQNCWMAVTGGGSLYLNDWRYDTGTDVSYLKAYTLDGNILEDGGSIDIASGAGYSGPTAARVITNNVFNIPSDVYWAVISFSGSGTGVPWFVYSVGGAVITGNTFNGGDEHIIRARGLYDNTQFDWASYWNNNTFSRRVAFGPDPPSVMGTFSYPSGPYTMNNVRHIAGFVQQDIEYAQAGDKVLLGAGTYPVPAVVTLNKANVTVQGAGSAASILQVSGTGERLNIAATGVTVKDLAIQKTDKVGVQNIIYVGANDFTLKNTIISGQYIYPDGDVSRAIVTTGGLSGLLFEGNTFFSLRQPAYVSGPTTGLVKNNLTYGTKGWVLEGGDLTFEGNTWGSGPQTNVYDIAILSMAPLTAYTDIVAMSDANNEAVIEDQRVSPAVLSVSYVDKATSFSDDMGGKFHPYATIAPAITRVVTGGKIYVAAGTYNESVAITKRLTLDGAGSGADPVSNTVITGPGTGNGITTVAGASATSRLVIKDVRVTGFVNGVYGSSFMTLENVAIVGNSNAGIELNPLADLVINNCKSDGNFMGMRAGTAANVENVTITNSSFNGNTAQGWFIAAQKLAGGSTFSNVHVTNCTFNDNLQKGIYVEKLEEAVFDGITVSNSGTDPAYGFNNGIDINLKYGAYQNIQILNSTITGSGATGTSTDITNPAAVAIKARNDGSDYGSLPATLDNVLIQNSTISGPQNALRFGEFGKVNAGPTNVVIKNSTINGIGAGRYHVINRTSANILANEGNTFTGSTTMAQIEAKVLHGLDDAALGVVNYGQMAGTYSDIWVDDSWAGTTPGAPVDGHWFGANAFATIQEAINAVVVPGTVNVADGAYNEAVTVGKNQLTIRRSGAGVVTVTAPNTSVDVLTLTGNQLNISGLTLTGGKNGIYGTTANSRFLSLIVTGNAANGIQLVDADNNFMQALTVSNQTAGAGIRLTGARQNTISGNTLQGNNFNVLVEINAARHASGNIIQGNNILDPGAWGVRVTNAALTTAVNFNVFNTTGTMDKYVSNTDPAELNAQYNWFGGEATPQPTDFSGNINFANNYATLPTVAIFPVTHYMPQNSTVNVSVMALIPNGTTVKGVDVNLSWDNDSVIPDDGDPFEGPFFTSAGGSSFFEFIKPTGNTLRVNQSLLSTGGMTGGALPYVNVLFTQAFKSGAVDGTSNILLASAQMRDVANAPITIELDPNGTPQATLIVDGTAPVVTVALDNITNTWTNAYLRNGDAIGVTAKVTETNPLTTGDITANLNGFFGGSGHSADNPTSLVGADWTWPTVASAVCNPLDGTITVTVTATDVLGNVGTGTATIIADNTKPTSLANFRATPGHKKVNLSWDDASANDANYRGVKVQYNVTSDYPLYAAAAPAFPATDASGSTALVVTDGSVTATHTFATDDRGIYYYRGFVVDQAGNTSDPNGPGNDADRSTNYILGDLGSGPGIINGTYDGKVNFEDLSLFSYLYFEPQAGPAGWPYPAAAEADFGPTTNNKTYGNGSRFGIPTPAGSGVEFEDLMIFSMNYGYTAPPKIAVPSHSVAASVFAVNLVGQSGTDGYAVTVHLGNDGRAVKGASVEIAYDPSVLKVAGVTRGDLFGGEGQAFYGHRMLEKSVRIDAAVLGKGVEVEHSGDLATIHFTVLKQGDPGLKIENADVRNAANAVMAVEAAQKVAELPTTYDLAQNYPNPFNPTTTVKYQVPSPAAVEVTVYNVLGEKVVTLVNEVQPAGYYTVQWNGRDSRNQTAPSGLYFYTMRAGDFTAVKKMMLMK